MNQATFRVVPSDHAPDTGEVEILIDGVNLCALVRKVEHGQPGAEEIAGGYASHRAAR